MYSILLYSYAVSRDWLLQVAFPISVSVVSLPRKGSEIELMKRQFSGEGAIFECISFGPSARVCVFSWALLLINVSDFA